jgi:AraC family ethanolamine operon transcriptional activator
MSSMLFPASPPVFEPKLSSVVRRWQVSNVERHAENMNEWRLHYEQLDCGSFESDLSDICLPGVQIFSERTSRALRQRGELLPGSLGLATMASGRGTVAMNGMRSGARTLLTAYNDIDMCTPPDCTLVGVVIDGALLDQAAALAPELKDGRRSSAWIGHTDQLQRLIDLVQGNFETATRQPSLLLQAGVQRLMRDDVLTAVIHLLEDLVPADNAERAQQRKRVVDRACEIMLAQPDEPVSLQAICEGVGASPRKLSYCFQDVLGMSPHRYLRTMRLNAARRELARGDSVRPSVYDVAAHWGFWHFGRFSVDYKRQFAESPSDTLKRTHAELVPA